jgi:spore coat protein CotH
MAQKSAIFFGAIVTAVLVVSAQANAQTTEPEPQPISAEALFDNHVLHRLDLRLHSADWAKLKEEFLENEYYPADLEWNGQTVRNIGIRSRGHGSRSGTKPGLRVDFDRYATDQTFLGLKSLVLDNLTQDSSGIHETSTVQLMAKMGVPAPREAHTRLYVNGEYVGLYAIVESVDKRLLARVFGVVEEDTQNDGYLFEFRWNDEWRLEYLGDELGPYRDRFDAKTHEHNSDEQKYRLIEEMVRVINDTREDRLGEALTPLLDIPALIRYLAAQNFVAQIDGVVGNWGVNNFYLYRLEGGRQHVFIDWDEDTSFWGPTYPTNQGLEDNVLTQKLMRVPEYRAMYYSELRRAMDLALEPVGDPPTPWFEAEIHRQLDLIDRAMREDTNKPFVDAWFDEARGKMLRFTIDRVAFIRCELERGARSGCESVVGQ